MTGSQKAEGSTPSSSTKFFRQGQMEEKFYFDADTADNLGIGLFKYALGPKEGFQVVNTTLARILGCPSKAGLKKMSISGLFMDVAERKGFFRALSKEGRVKFFEARFRKKNGKPVWVALIAFRIKKTGQAQYLEGIVEDISTHKEMEEKISLERDMFQGLLNNMPDAIYFKDTKNRITKVNKFYLKGIKRKLKDVIGKTDFDFFPREQARQMFEDDNHVLRTGKPIVGKIEKTLLSNGTWNQVITTKIPMYDKNGKIAGTMGITRDMTAYANLMTERFKMIMNSFVVLGKALEMRDPYTFSHTRNVALIAVQIAKALGWDEDRILSIRLASEIHDLGKISIPLDILNKPGKLGELEYQLIKRHVENCCNLIKDIDFPFSLSEIVYQHHERLDGSGYPRGLKSGQINEEARLLAICDVLESMTGHRPYRAALGIDKALEELKSGRGIRYDAKITDIAIDIIKKNKGKVFWPLS